MEEAGHLMPVETGRIFSRDQSAARYRADRKHHRDISEIPYTSRITIETVSSMEFLRTRSTAYLIGAVEFADNIRLNILDTLHPFKPSNSSSWSLLEGKASQAPIHYYVVDCF